MANSIKLLFTPHQQLATISYKCKFHIIVHYIWQLTPVGAANQRLYNFFRRLMLVGFNYYREYWHIVCVYRICNKNDSDPAQESLFLERIQLVNTARAPLTRKAIKLWRLLMHPRETLFGFLVFYFTTLVPLIEAKGKKKLEFIASKILQCCIMVIVMHRLVTIDFAWSNIDIWRVQVNEIIATIRERRIRPPRIPWHLTPTAAL